MRQAYLIILSLITAFALIPGVLADSSANPDSTAASSLREVRVQLKWVHQFQFAGYYVAIEKGYYRDAGLDVTLIEYSPGVTPVDQLMGGRVDFAVGDAGALIYRSAGAPLIALAAIFQHSPSILTVLKESGISELSDLRNKRAMLSGGYMNAELMSMLKSVGLTPNEFRLIPSDPDLNALIDGRTDAYNAYLTNEPYYLEKKGISYLNFVPRDYGVDFYGDILLTTERVIESNPQMVRKFVEATLKGWDYAARYPGEVVNLIFNKYNSQNKTREHLMFEAEEAIKLILPHVVPVGYMNEARWRHIGDIFREQGLMTQEVDLASFIYHPEGEDSLLSVMKRYMLEIFIGFVVLAGLVMISHIVRLRAQVSMRTKQLEEAKQRAEQEARTDLLTGLPNRRYFLEELARDIAQAERYDIPLSVISVDIDYFKKINDRHGHAAGDEALRCLGEVFRNYTRSGDIAARIGGEEFAMACLNTGQDEAQRLAERLSMEMKRRTINYDNESFMITLSIGIALREKGDNVEQLLRKADLALYEAKQRGRNTICVWNLQQQT